MSTHASNARRATLSLAIVFAGLTAMTGSASALSLGVKISCAADYVRHCSSFNPLGKEVRKCMYDAGPQLSESCVSALLEAGEVTQEQIEKRRAEVRAAKQQEMAAKH